MTHKSIILPLLLPLLFVSCANQSDSENYDVSNPYAAPNYNDFSDTPPLSSDVNPAYDDSAVSEDTKPAVPETAYTPPAVQAKLHTVVRGDSLWSISKKYSVSIDAIKKANGMTKDVVVLGKTLKIPAQ